MMKDKMINIIRMKGGTKMKKIEKDLTEKEVEIKI